MILIQCKSPHQDDCVWIFVQHAVDFNETNDKETIVELNSGSTIRLSLSKQSFDRKLKKTYELNYKMTI